MEAEHKHGSFMNELQGVIDGAKPKFTVIENNIKFNGETP